MPLGLALLATGAAVRADVAALASFPAVVELSSLDGTNGFVLEGSQAGARSGASVSGAGDVNGDGIEDLLIGAWGASPDGQRYAGASYVVFGRDAGFPAAFELRSLYPQSGGDGSAGFVLKGIDAEDFSGVAVSGAGDVNGDGIADIVIGAWGADPDGRKAAGESYVVFGAAASARAGAIPVRR